MTNSFGRLAITAAIAALALPAAAQPTPAPASPPAAETPAGPPAGAATPAAAAPAPAAADTPATASTGRVPAPPAGKGQVVFFRPSRIGGMAVSFSLDEGGNGIGKLTNGTYIVLVADPGPHAYSTLGEARDTLNVEIEAGETIYVEQTIGVGLVMARPHLQPSNQQAFDKLNPKSMRPVKSPAA